MATLENNNEESPSPPKPSTQQFVEPQKSWRSMWTSWKAQFVMPLLMVGLALLGLFGALGHHLYYQGLHGQVVLSPDWPTRFGIALSFFVKLSLISAVDIAYRQQAWVVVKKRDLHVSTLDALFSACSDPFQFLSGEFLLKATIPAVMAGLVWALPLCAIASPSTLTSRGGIQTRTTTCENASFLDFSRENGYGLFSDDNSRAALSYWNTIGDELHREDGHYIYNSPSAELQRMFQLSILSTVGPLKPPNPCPLNTSCTYSMDLSAPAYRCESRPEFGGGNPLGYKKSQFSPSGRLVYASYSSFGETEGGRPLAWNSMEPSDPELGTFTEVPSLWVGWVTNSNNHKPHIAECMMRNVRYTYNITFSENDWSISRTAILLDRPFLLENSSKSPLDDDYQQFAGYHAAGYLHRMFFEGNITLNPDNSYFVEQTKLLQTDLIDQTTMLPASSDFAHTLEDRFNSLFLSMLTDKQLHSQFNSSVPCSVVASVQVWNYEPFWLVLSYSIAVACTFVAISVGAYSFYQNGYSVETLFSTFIMTTRSADVDELARGHCLGKWPADKSVLDTRLKFGEVLLLTEQNGYVEPHAGFGFPENVQGLDMQKKYM